MTEGKTKWAIDWRIEGYVEVEAETESEAQAIFDKRFGQPGFASAASGEISTGKPYRIK